MLDGSTTRYESLARIEEPNPKIALYCPARTKRKITLKLKSLLVTVPLSAPWIYHRTPNYNHRSQRAAVEANSANNVRRKASSCGGIFDLRTRLACGTTGVRKGLYLYTGFKEQGVLVFEYCSILK